MVIVGIYKITSPSGKVYIGQSRNIKRRWAEHVKPFNKLPKLANSMKKYGADQHVFTIVHELPSDVTQTILDNYEIYYSELYLSCGVDLLNLRYGRGNGRLSEETKKKISEYFTGRSTGRTMSDELKKVHSARMKERNIGNQLGKMNKGRKFSHSQATKQNISKGHQKLLWHVYQDGDLIGVFVDSHHAASVLGIPASTIRRIKNVPVKSRGRKKSNRFEIVTYERDLN